MENIICSYRGNFKATVLNLFYSLGVDIKKMMLACNTYFIDRIFLISCMLTPRFYLQLRDAYQNANIQL